MGEITVRALAERRIPLRNKGCCSAGRILGSEFARDELLLYTLQRFRFGHFARRKLFVKLLHYQAGAGIVDRPEGCHDGFHLVFEEKIADARDFDAVAGAIAYCRFTGRQHDEVNVAQPIVAELVNQGCGEILSASWQRVGG